MSRFVLNLANSRFFLSLREAFISLIPFFVISSIAILVKDLLLLFPWFNATSLTIEVLRFTSNVILQLFPAAIVLSLSYYLSKNLGTNTIAGSVLSFACFSVHTNYIDKLNDVISLVPNNASAYSLIIPALTIYGLRWALMIPNPWRPNVLGVSRFLTKHLMLIMPFSIVFAAMFIVVPAIEWLAQQLLVPLVVAMEQGEPVYQVFKRMLFTHSAWFFGVHGDNTYIMLFTDDIMKQELLPNISAQVFYNTFVLVGGTGCFWGLIIAGLLQRKGSYETKILKLSAPFSIFNFCEIILFALPILLNPIFLIPFFAAPIFNFCLSYWMLSAGLVPYSGIELSWMTPTLISGWLVGDSVITPLYQLMLILCNAAIYYPFLKFSMKHQDWHQAIDKLEQKLKISERIDGDNEQQFLEKQLSGAKEDAELVSVLQEIAQGELLLYYQPQIAATTGQVVGFEALLRLKKVDGKIVGPYFLDTLIKHQQSETIDKWVVKQACADLAVFAQMDLQPNISINLNPQALNHQYMIDYICQYATPYNGQLKIEIVESSLLENSTQVSQHIQQLQQHGIDTVIDDFGTGYSNLTLLSTLPIKAAKLDRSILVGCESQQGKVLYQQVSQLFNRLGYTVVAEGVETQAELEWVESLGIDTIQGWYYAPALPLIEVVEYWRNNMASKD